MFDVKRLVSALPEGTIAVSERSDALDRLHRFSPDHQLRGSTYLAWKLFDDCGRDVRRFPGHPYHQLQLISRTVRRECERVNTLREQHGWEGPDSEVLEILERLFAELPDDGGAGAGHVLDSMVLLAITSREVDLDTAIELVEFVADSLPGTPSGTSVGSEGSLSAHGRSVIRYLTREINDFESRRRSACTEVEGLAREDFAAIASWADVLGAYKDGEYVDRLDFTIFPPGIDPNFHWGGGDGGGLLRESVVDAQRFSIFDELERNLSTKAGVVCRRINSEASSDPTSRLSASLSDYQVMTIRGGPFKGEHAVAVSPMALEDAVYIVRADVAKVHWSEVLQHPKREAREYFHARKVLVPRGDKYEYRRAAGRVEALLTCTTREFRSGAVSFDSYLDKYVVC